MLIAIKPVGGLCNLLRATFSYYHYAKSIDAKLVVIWEPDKDCNGFFLDYFEPVEGITFLRNNKDNFGITYSGCHWHPSYDPYEMFLYQDLKPLPHVMTEVNKKMSLLGGNYVAVHIRRTDHNGGPLGRTGDGEFIEFGIGPHGGTV